MKALTIEAFKELAKHHTIIDTRKIGQLKEGFIKGSISLSTITKLNTYIGLVSGFKSNTGIAPILLVCEEDENEELQNHAEKLGIKIEGKITGGFEAWKKAGEKIDMIIDVEPDELMMDIPFDENLVMMDIRSAIDFGNGHLKDAINLPLAEMADPLRLSAILDSDNLYIVGENDEDVFMAATILKSQDINNIRVVLGGWDAIQREKKATIVKEPRMLN